jgi:small subunit ribosomal protein S6
VNWKDGRRRNLANNVYECLLILDSNRYARDPGGVSGQIPKIVEKCGGETLASRLWNEQKLSYPINGQRKGTYWLTFFRMDSQKVVDFNRECQLSESILRNLTTKVEPRLVDALVAHAKGEVKEEPPEEPVAEASEQPAVDAGEQPEEAPAEEAPAEEAPAQEALAPEEEPDKAAPSGE